MWSNVITNFQVFWETAFPLTVLVFILSFDWLHLNLCTLNLSTNGGKRKKQKHGNVISHFTPAHEWQISARAKLDLLSCQSTGLAPTEPDHNQISLVETLCLSDRTVCPKPLTRSALICRISAPVVGQLLIEWTRLPKFCKPHDLRVWLTLNIKFILSLFCIVLWTWWEPCDKVLCWWC